MKKVVSMFVVFTLVLTNMFWPNKVSALSIAEEETVIYSNFNIDGVQSGPKEKYTGFKFNEKLRGLNVVITSITTYHYFNNGKAPGQIALADDKGNVYGPWQAVGRAGQGGVQNAYWDAPVSIPLTVNPDIVYGVTVNDTRGWSHNSKSGGYGFVEIKGYYIEQIPLFTPSINPVVKDIPSIKQTVQTNKDTVIGSLEKTNWKIQIPQNSFDKDTELKVDFITDTMKYKKSGVDVIGSIVDINASGGKSVRLNQPATISMKVPAGTAINDKNLDNYLAGYWTGTEWDYIFPDPVELKKGYVKFETFHFSPYALLKVDEKEKLELYAKNMAIQQWANNKNNTAVQSKIEDIFTDTFEKMGLSDKTVQGQIMRAIVSEADFGTLITAAEQGDISTYTSKCGEMAAKAIIQKYKNGDKYLMKLAKDGGYLATGIGKGLIAAYDGNYVDAIKEIQIGFLNRFPYTRAFLATKDAIEAGVNTWRDSEVEYAYKSYNKMVGDGVYGYVSTDDWETLMQQMRGALVRMNQEAIQAYAKEEKMGIDDIPKDKLMQIRAKVSQRLKKAFELRKKEEVNIKKQEEVNKKIIEGFIKDGLLTRGTFRFDVDHDINNRLRTLFAVRNNILGIFDGTMPILKTGESSEQNLNEAISMWIQYGTKDRDKFYNWLEKKGYFGKTETPKEEEEDPNANTPFKTGPVEPGSPFDISPGGGRISPQDQKVYEKWLEENGYFTPNPKPPVILK